MCLTGCISMALCLILWLTALGIKLGNWRGLTGHKLPIIAAAAVWWLAKSRYPSKQINQLNETSHEQEIDQLQHNCSMPKLSREKKSNSTGKKQASALTDEDVYDVLSMHFSLNSGQRQAEDGNGTVAELMAEVRINEC